jgi:hypothetical protein
VLITSREGVAHRVHLPQQPQNERWRTACGRLVRQTTAVAGTECRQCFRSVRAQLPVLPRAGAEERL